MSDIITRRGLERALNALNAEYFVVAGTTVSYESAHCFISVYGWIRREHPDVRSADELARCITPGWEDASV